MSPEQRLQAWLAAAPGIESDRRRLLLGAAGFFASVSLLGRGSARAIVEPLEATAGGDLPGDLWRAGARQLGAAIKKGEVSSLEVVEAHLARIEAVNEKVNAFVALYPEEARAAARAADAAVSAGRDLGPLHGVPFSIKDNLDQLGKPNTNGLVENLNNEASRDSAVVERMRAAGGVPLGRTNLPDMGLRVHTFSDAWGRTLNPWSSKHNVAGSSGGEAAALATGMSPIGLGNDIGGSLRNPATCCAIASLKPSLGRVPRFPEPGGGGIGGQLMAVDGPMARTVGDVRLGYEILAGPHPGDAWSAPVALDLPRPESKKVALMPEPSGGETHPSVAASVRQAGRALADAGYQVEEIEPPDFVGVVNTWVDLIMIELEGARSFFRQVMNEEATRFIDLIYESWEGRGMETLTSALQRRHGLGSAWSEFFVDYPLVVGPIFTEPPFEVGYDIAGKDEAWDVLTQLRLTVAANILSLPAAAVPTGIGDDGLPRGVQVIGARFHDGLCLEGAQAIEDALGTFTPIDPRA